MIEATLNIHNSEGGSTFLSFAHSEGNVNISLRASLDFGTTAIQKVALHFTKCPLLDTVSTVPILSAVHLK